MFSAELPWCLVFVQKINYEEKSGKICQKLYFTRRSTEPEDETKRMPGGPTPTPGAGPPLPAPRGGAATPGNPSASLYAYKFTFDLKTEGGSIVFQKEFRYAAATRNQDSDPETPFWHPARTWNLERIITIVITNSPSTIDVSPIHE